MFKLEFKNGDEEIIVTKIEYKMEKNCPFWDASYMQHNVITLYNKFTKKRASFDFWGSRINPDCENEEDLKNALSCLCSDAYSSTYDKEEFFNLFGYNSWETKSHKIYKECCKTHNKLERVLGDYSILEQFNEES